MDDVKTNDKMEQLNKRRDERGLLERARAGFWAKQEAIKQRRNDNLAATEGILDLKYQSDSLLLMGLFNNWFKNAKTTKQTEILNESFTALMRIQSYVSNLQTVSRSAVGEMLDERTENNKLHAKVQTLEKQIETLKAEIEHYENE